MHHFLVKDKIKLYFLNLLKKVFNLLKSFNLLKKVLIFKKSLIFLKKF